MAAAIHDPLAEWAVSAVLTAPDLLEKVLGAERLNVWDCAAAATCKAWQQAWSATRELRRGLRSSPVIACPGLMRKPNFGWHRVRGSVLGQEALCLVDHEPEAISIVNSAGHVVSSTPYDGIEINEIAVSACGGFLYASGDTGLADDNTTIAPTIQCLQIADGLRVGQYQDDDVAAGDDRYNVYPYQGFAEMAVGPEDTLFAVCYFDARESEAAYIPAVKDQCKIVALEPISLRKRFQFGQPQFRGQLAFGLAVNQDAIFVGCHNKMEGRRDASLQVFSLDGEPLREIALGRMVPDSFFFQRDRLYVVPSCGFHPYIVVMAPDGTVLQHYEGEGWERKTVGRVLPFGNRLLVGLTGLPTQEYPTGPPHAYLLDGL